MRLFGIIFILCFSFGMQGQGRAHYKRVLFLGNSYTYYNNLPQLVADIASSNGDTVFFSSNNIGGYSFKNHWQDVTSTNMIINGTWDYVVLQAQSQEPSFSPQQVNAQTLPYAIKLDSLVDASQSCAMTVFYETWGRKNGDQGNCPFYPPICTYLGMQDRLRDSYRLFADTCKALMAPVGEAWRASIAQTPTLELYQSDESHPVIAGTYIAASVLYETFFKHSVLTSTFDPGFGPTLVGYLRNVSHQTMIDSLSQWGQGKYAPWAHFNVTPQNAATFGFNADALNTNNLWRFGDGNTSSASQPVHTYSASGIYTVSHISWIGCKKDSASAQITASVTNNTTGLPELSGKNAIKVFPNPCGDWLRIDGDFDIKGLAITDMYGKTYTTRVVGNNISTKDLAPGIYFLRSEQSDSAMIAKFVKQ